ncbi:ATP-dependent RNA helicase HrpA [Thiomicrospira sp. WB1]|uniref:ATP-dependent RNA helicase HrpA n=1 Tax=Thiomicrospira sp. WB1 TaxID=1685380 RepID=UPI0007480248|nr:ATP-dependent RNA helicase HrpA [Thiomicrospira sp. WB1]KUJ72203.1 ATP-dependent RNA helicase HrpA [Thiomicrospira sp. WB1]
MQILNAQQAINAIDTTLSKDRHRLRQQLKRLKVRADMSKAAFSEIQSDPDWEKWLHRLQASQAQVEANRRQCPSVDYPDLPVAQRREEIIRTVQNHQVVVIAGETGSGKTTQIPKMCLDAGRGVFGRIGCTQPRRLAARSVAERLAEELDSKLGDTVGYQVRFHDQVHQRSLIKVMTDGILLAELQKDRFLNQYDTIIIDEAHERSINIDFLLGILKQLLPKRPDLKVIITSATIDTERFSRHFNNAPIIEVSGRTYPVEVRYRPLASYEDDDGQTFEQDIPTAIGHALDELSEEDPFGDVLVFQVGERDIKETAETLRKQKLPHTEIIPLYARLSMSEQNKVFQTSQKRRVILATNVAETSLTVPGIKFVIDPGLVRISRYSVRSKVQRLPIEKISQASANQRAGRCGRVSEGICIRLYDEDDFHARAQFTPPEIHRTSLATVILQMTQMRLGQVKHFPFIEPPEDKAVNDGYRQLHELGALDDQRRLTEAGQTLARLPLDPRMAKMVLEGQKNGVLMEVLVIATALSIQDPRDMNESTRQAAAQAHKPFEDPRSDFLFFLNLWRFYEDKRRHLSQNKLRKLCKTNFLSYLRMKEWHDLFFQIEVSLKRQGIKIHDLHLYEEVRDGGKVREQLADVHAIAVHRALMSGLLGNLAVREDDKRYQGARNTKVFIHPSSVLFKRKPKWLVSAELVETSKVFARNNAAIDVKWVESLASHLVKHSYDDPHWQKKRGQVGAFESVTLYGLPIVNRRRCNYGPINPKEAHKIFLRHALVEGQMHCRLDFFVHNQQLIRDIEQVESKLRRPDFLVDDEQLYDFYAERIPGHIYNQPALETWVKQTRQKAPEKIDALFLTREQLLKQSVDTDRLAHDFPDQIQLGNHLPLKLDYAFEPGKKHDGMMVKLPLAQLNQVQAKDFEWLTPGLLREKTAHYIKALPKSLRKQFIPAPQTAELVLQEMSPDKKIDGQKADYLTQLVWALNRRGQNKVKLNDFESVTLPEHCLPFYRLQDEKGRTLAESADLGELKHDYQHLVTASLKKSQPDQASRKPITDWDFGDLPDSETLKTPQGELTVYPVLKLDGNTLYLDKSPDQDEADRIHGEGVLALCQTLLFDKVRYMQRQLPLKQACLCFAPYGTCQDLTEQIIHRALQRLVPAPGDIRTQAGFEEALVNLKQSWIEEAQALSKMVSDTLKRHQKLAKRLKGNVNPRLLGSIQDIRTQLDGLVYAQFINETPDQWLKQLPRYLQGLEKRLEKVELDPSKDLTALKQLQPLLKHYETIASDPAYQKHPGLVEIRWLLEELRLSLFAQPMKTLQPVSIQRVDKKLRQL